MIEKSSEWAQPHQLMEYRQLLGNIVGIKVGHEDARSFVCITLNTIAQKFILRHDHPAFVSMFKVVLAAGESKSRVILHVDDSTDPGVLHAIEHLFSKFKE